MRVTREKVVENRSRIVDSASRLFREHGFDGVGLDAIMKGAGLTHGGFYGHFASKEDLAAGAVAVALERRKQMESRFKDLGDLVSDYLSERHCVDRANGCVLAALGADLARQGRSARRQATAYVRTQLDRFARLLRGGTAASRRQRAITTLAGLVGALTLARMVDDPAMSSEILSAARNTFGQRPRTGRACRSEIADPRQHRGNACDGRY